jgi:hypothetical protein
MLGVSSKNHGAEPLSNVLQMLAVCAAALVGDVALAAVEQVPSFDVDPSCRAAASRAGSQSYESICRRKEQQARATLEQLWPQFTSADRTQCVQLSTLGGKPTYTELLTCLELARDARALRGRPAPVTTGSARQSRGR